MINTYTVYYTNGIKVVIHGRDLNHALQAADLNNDILNMMIYTWVSGRDDSLSWNSDYRQWEPKKKEK
jgi:hypothetical protein